MQLLYTLGCYSTHPTKHFLIVRGLLGILARSPTNALWGTNLDCMVASGTMLFFDRNPDKLWVHVAGHCPAVKSADVAAREGLQRGRGSYPCILQLSYCPLQQSTAILPRAQCLPRPQRSHPQTYPVRLRKRRQSVPRDVGIHDVDHP